MMECAVTLWQRSVPPGHAVVGKHAHVGVAPHGAGMSMHPTGVGGAVGALQPGRLAKLGQLAE
jgi:hypothetical protein